MDLMNYLAYAAREPMKELRRQFNNGENVIKTTPPSLSAKNAERDVLYLRYVFENAYSGYPYFKKRFFDNAFDTILKELREFNQITPNALIDLICSRLSFITDGHLALTTQDYGKGFYQKRQLYVSDMLLTKSKDRYYDLKSGRLVCFDAPIRALPTIAKDAENAYLIGVRSTESIEKVYIEIDGASTDLPVHKIASKAHGKETPLKEYYGNETAIISCSTFVGDSEELMNKFYECGLKCRKYKHVIWDLSNNSGGNSELPKRFLLGLMGGFSNTVKYLELKSALVHAKEYGHILDIPYHFESSSDIKSENANLFAGELHVIINDRVGSSAEIAIAWAASLPHTTFYGCNSAGIGRFGDLCVYYLPNSRITLWCPQKVFDTGIVETVGFEPDYWIESENVASVVLNKINESSDA